MTNIEKFEETFGFKPCCVTMCDDCPHKHGDDDEYVCEEVKFWASEYKEKKDE